MAALTNFSTRSTLGRSKLFYRSCSTNILFATGSEMESWAQWCKSCSTHSSNSADTSLKSCWITAMRYSTVKLIIPKFQAVSCCTSAPNFKFMVVQLQGKQPLRFAEASFKVAREHFGLKQRLTLSQFVDKVSPWDKSRQTVTSPSSSTR